MIKVLMIMYEPNICNLIRIGWPATCISENHQDEVELSLITGEFNPWDIALLRQFDIIHFHSYFGRFESSEELWGKLQAQGVKMIMDLDDYWFWPEEMPITKALKEQGLYGRAVETLKLADYVTVTTRHFAELVKEHNENVKVLPNGIHVKHEIWQDNVTDSDVVRIAWLGSVQRLHDLERLRKGIKMIYSDKDLEGKFSFAVYGARQEDATDIFEGPGFKRYDAESPNTYANYYDNVDVCLAPLDRIVFNSCRSELKYVEAGVKKKVFIGENFTPYAEDIEHGVTGMLVDTPEEWYSCMRQVILNKDLRDTLRNNLHDLVKDKFDIENVVKDRVEFYKSICKDGE
jgi:glycosyltransferase involved in cell wall biosynthesis